MVRTPQLPGYEIIFPPESHRKRGLLPEMGFVVKYVDGDPLQARRSRELRARGGDVSEHMKAWSL